MSLPLRYASLDQLPFIAPQFVNHVLDLGQQELHQPKQIITTLDRNQQILLERILQRYVRDHGAVGIHNADAMLIDVRDLSVRAMIGSADFNNVKIDGQVNGTLAKRSPGSALKPFIYALAMDQGLIHPLSMLKDVPTSFGSFSPENFDGRFARPSQCNTGLNSVAQYSRRRIKRPLEQSNVVPVPAKRRHITTAKRTTLWSGIGFGRRRSHHGRTGNLVCHARQSWRSITTALQNERETVYRHTTDI